MLFARESFYRTKILLRLEKDILALKMSWSLDSGCSKSLTPIVMSLPAKQTQLQCFASNFFPSLLFLKLCLSFRISFRAYSSEFAMFKWFIRCWFKCVQVNSKQLSLQNFGGKWKIQNKQQFALHLIWKHVPGLFILPKKYTD